MKFIFLKKNKKCLSMLVNKMIFLTEGNFDKELSLKNLAEELGRNPDYLSNLFKQEVGIKFVEYITSCRIEKAMEYLDSTDLNVYRIADLVGYRDHRYFTRVFKIHTSKTPNEYRRRNQDEGF